jgi:cytidylate kinase
MSAQGDFFMIKRYYVFVLSLFLPITIFGNHAVFILGPSCSGKSTAAFHLARELGDDWKLVAYDRWEARIGRNNAPATLIFTRAIDEARDHLDNGYSVIIDANRYFSPLCACLTQSGHTCTNVYLYAPFKILKKRCKKRFKEHRHGTRLSKAARTFLKQNFAFFYPHGIPEQTDGLVIDTTQISRDTLIKIIKEEIGKK